MTPIRSVNQAHKGKGEIEWRRWKDLSESELTPEFGQEKIDFLPAETEQAHGFSGEDEEGDAGEFRRSVWEIVLFCILNSSSGEVRWLGGTSLHFLTYSVVLHIDPI